MNAPILQFASLAEARASVTDGFVLIPESRVVDAVKSFAKLHARAVKLGVEPPTIDVHGVNTYRVPGERRGTFVDFNLRAIRVQGNAPKLAGYSLAGELDHRDGVNIFRSVPGNPIPESYRNAPVFCEHCKTKRSRKISYVVKGEGDKYVQVGSACIADFLGHADPKTLLAYYDAIVSPSLGVIDDEDYFKNVLGEPTYSTGYAIAVAVSIIRQHGFVSGKAARESLDKRPTAADLASYFYNRGRIGIPEEEQRALAAYDPTDADREKAEKIKAFLLGADTTGNDYLTNAKIIASQTAIFSRDFGLLASLPSAYDRAQGAKAERETKSNLHVGEVGKRLDFRVRVTGSTGYSGAYGDGLLVRFEDELGNSLTWFSSRVIDLPEAGVLVNITATVKKHDNYKGRNQTVLNRVVFADEPATVA